MHVASLELSKQLFEVSGWKLTYLEWIWYDNYSANKPTEPQLRKRTGHGAIDAKYRVPAYDLGYLLRKLHPHGIMLRSHAGSQWCGMVSPDYITYADTPEDCAAKLAIELFQQGILVK